MKKTIIITGVSGQDGSYMAEYCLNLGHKVIAMARRTSQVNDKNYHHLLHNPDFKIVRGDLLDGHSINNIVREFNPDYFINFAAQSFVGDSWKIPEETFIVGAVGVLKCLEAIRTYAPNCRFYNAGSSEEFGDVLYSPQDEAHPARPRSPYGAAKAAARLLVKVYRESYGLYAVQGYLFNHESERRGTEFVTRKITKGIARIKKAILNKESFEPIELGNIYSKRDWSHAADFMDGVWRMLNQDVYNKKLKDQLYLFDEASAAWKFLIKNLQEYVLASGETHTIKEFVEKAFIISNISGQWVGNDIEEQFVTFNFPDEIGFSKILLKINKNFYRPNEVDLLLGNPNKAKEELDWNPNISFDKLVERMVKWDLYESGIIPMSNYEAGKETSIK